MLYMATKPRIARRSSVLFYDVFSSWVVGFYYPRTVLFVIFIEFTAMKRRETFLVKAVHLLTGLLADGARDVLPEQVLHPTYLSLSAVLLLVLL